MQPLAEEGEPSGEPEQEVPLVQEAQEVDVPAGEPEDEIPPAQEAQEPQEVEGPSGETSDIRPKQSIHPGLQIPAGGILIVESGATLVTQCNLMLQSMQQESQDVVIETGLELELQLQLKKLSKSY